MEVQSLCVHDHPCSIYENNEELKQQTVPYLQAGLLAGEQCIYFLFDNTKEFVVDAMQDDEFDVQKYLQNGAFKIVHTSQVHLLGGFFSTEKMMDYWNLAVIEAQEEGFESMRAVVEMTWALSGKPGCEALAAYEAHLNKFIETKNISVLCAYNRRKFSPELLKAIIHAHPLVISGNRVLRNPNVIPAERFVQGDAELDVQATLDNLELIEQLNTLNKSLEIQQEYSKVIYDELLNLSKTVSHELQEPLSAVVSYLRLLSVRYKSKLGEDADEFIDRSVTGALTASRMIDDLWVYARIDAPQYSGDYREIDSMKLLAVVLEELNETIERTRSKVTCSNLPRLSTFPKHLKFIFSELITNATKYGGLRPAIEISSERVEDGWQFAIKDSGIGIDPIYSTEIFHMFRRLGKRPSETGSGMGLAIVKRMVEHDGGKIWFESTPGHGTTFFFTLLDEGAIKLAGDETIQVKDPRRHFLQLHKRLAG